MHDFNTYELSIKSCVIKQLYACVCLCAVDIDLTSVYCILQEITMEKEVYGNMSLSKVPLFLVSKAVTLG